MKALYRYVSERGVLVPPQEGYFKSIIDRVNGQEAGICTRTVSFTGRDAAGYTTILKRQFEGLRVSESVS